MRSFTTNLSGIALQLYSIVMIECSHAQSSNEIVLFLFAARGVRKVTTGITGLWPRSVQSDAAF